ncbi:MAG TPA: UxaA family hydrolase, partial [Tepidisphaeraceae bacterium]|nr:UxaA family hydrolase [Tepidisphaeraceae bacterium]
MPERLTELAVVVDPARDDVAVARWTIEAGTAIDGGALGVITLRATVQAGHRFAIRAVLAGDWVKQYGQPFAKSRGIVPGDPVDATTVVNEVPSVGPDEIEIRPPALEPWQGPRPTFEGFRRADGRVGVRNWVLIVPTSMCSSHEAQQIAMRAEMGGVWSRDRYPNVDGVTAIPHTRGCGCPDYEPRAAGDTTKLTGVVEASMNMLGRYIAHPNVGAVLVIELGCEKTNVNAVGKYVRLGGKDDGGRMKDERGSAGLI